MPENCSLNLDFRQMTIKRGLENQNFLRLIERWTAQHQKKNKDIILF